MAILGFGRVIGLCTEAKLNAHSQTERTVFTASRLCQDHPVDKIIGFLLGHVAKKGDSVNCPEAILYLPSRCLQ